MAKPMKPLVKGGGVSPSDCLTPLVYSGGYTTIQDKEHKAETSKPNADKREKPDANSKGE